MITQMISSLSTQLSRAVPSATEGSSRQWQPKPQARLVIRCFGEFPEVLVMELLGNAAEQWQMPFLGEKPESG